MEDFNEATPKQMQEKKQKAEQQSEIIYDQRDNKALPTIGLNIETEVADAAELGMQNDTRNKK